jgi:hypothetical protein
VPLERKYQTREGGALELRRKEWLAIVRCAVDDEGAPGYERECRRDSCVFECIRRNDCEGRCFFGIRGLGFCDCRREGDVMSKANQRLSESFEKCNILSDENHFRHYRVSILSIDRERKLFEALTSI